MSDRDDDDDGYEGCTVIFWDCRGIKQTTHRRMPVGMESDSEEALDYIYNLGLGPDGAYGYPELLYDSEKEEQEEKEQEDRVNWWLESDVFRAFRRCAKVLSKDFDFSVEKLIEEVKRESR